MPGDDHYAAPERARMQPVLSRIFLPGDYLELPEMGSHHRGALIQ
jgi:hypothetical protein